MAFVLRSILRPTLQRNLWATTAKTTNCLHTATLRYASASAEGVSTSSEINSSQSNADEPKLLVSDSCLKRLREICKDGSFLRITVEGGGCSGFQYKFDLDSKMNEDDRTFGEAQAKVVIDSMSLEYCAGGTIDYHTELIRSGFRMLANPQAEQGCSCGASFAIKLN